MRLRRAFRQPAHLCVTLWLRTRDCATLISFLLLLLKPDLRLLVALRPQPVMCTLLTATAVAQSAPHLHFLLLIIT